MSNNNNINNSIINEKNAIYERLTEIFNILIYNKNLSISERKEYDNERLKLLTRISELNK